MQARPAEGVGSGGLGSCLSLHTTTSGRMDKGSGNQWYLATCKLREGGVHETWAAGAPQVRPGGGGGGCTSSHGGWWMGRHDWCSVEDVATWRLVYC